MNPSSCQVNIACPTSPMPSYQIPEIDEAFYLPLLSKQSEADILTINLSNEERTRKEALTLINRRYAWRGYGNDHQLSGRRHETTFTAHLDELLIGTVTLGADSDRGLNVDATFPEEMQFFRRKQNTRLCELKKLAMDCGSPSKPVLAALFHFVFIYGTHNYLGTDLMIEVNPRHAPFYERMLGFRRVGAVRENVSVKAPSQLMWLAVSDIESAINTSAKTPNNTLYKYFYSVNYVNNIIHQLDERRSRDEILQNFY